MTTTATTVKTAATKVQVGVAVVVPDTDFFLDCHPRENGDPFLRRGDDLIMI